MKVLHFINSLEIGGAQRLVVELLPLLRQAGIETDVLLLEAKNEFDDTRFLHIPYHKYSLCYYRRLLHVMNQYDIVHAHLFPPLYIASLLSFFGKFKIIYTEHNTSNRRRKLTIVKPIEQFVYRRYARVISISHETQESLQNWLSVNKPHERFVCIPNGVNLDAIRFPAGQTEIDDIANNPPAEKYILMISRFSQAKDQISLIKALPAVNDPKIKIYFAGDGPTQEHCIQTARAIGMEKRICFLGNRTDIPQLIHNSLLGVQSSHWEGFGLTAVEFMAAGKPIIASDVPGLNNIVKGAGLLFPAGNSNELAKKINELLDDPALYSSVANACRKRAEEYDIKLMANRYIKLYNSL